MLVDAAAVRPRTVARLEIQGVGLTAVLLSQNKAQTALGRPCFHPLTHALWVVGWCGSTANELLPCPLLHQDIADALDPFYVQVLVPLWALVFGPFQDLVSIPNQPDLVPLWRPAFGCVSVPFQGSDLRSEGVAVVGGTGEGIVEGVVEGNDMEVVEWGDREVVDREVVEKGDREVVEGADKELVEGDGELVEAGNKELGWADRKIVEGADREHVEGAD